MSDIELVVKIDKDIYEDIIENGFIYDEDNEVVTHAIKNGTPLPKGHGRIKDIDKIEWYGCTSELECPHKNRECKDCDGAECSKTQVDGIPTIIEADKEYEAKVITRGNCMMCGKELTEGLFFCKECEAKAIQGRSEGKE